jgi:hypothetical protein
MRHLNRLGLILSVVYLALTLFLVWAALRTEGDLKGQFILLQLPIALQLAVLDLLGLAAHMHQWSFPVAYSVLVPAACFALYISGIAVTHVWSRSRSLTVAIVLTAVAIFLFRTPLRQLIFL